MSDGTWQLLLHLHLTTHAFLTLLAFYLSFFVFVVTLFLVRLFFTFLPIFCISLLKTNVHIYTNTQLSEKPQNTAHSLGGMMLKVGESPPAVLLAGGHLQIYCFTNGPGCMLYCVLLFCVFVAMFQRLLRLSWTFSCFCLYECGNVFFFKIKLFHFSAFFSFWPVGQWNLGRFVTGELV